MSVTSIGFAGPRALLVDLSDLDAVLALHARLLSEQTPGQLDVLPAASTVLVTYDTRAHALSARAAIEHWKLGKAPRGTGETVEIPVVYDGEDLDEVARLTGLSPEAVVNAHTGQIWTAAFGGFAPGFAYLTGENQQLNVPRRNTPRTAVPAGSVALAGNHSAVYPRKSPGGWQLIGHTNSVLWDIARPNPALISPQDHVQFTAVRESIRAPLAVMPGTGPVRDTNPQHYADAEFEGLEVISTGMRSLLQDLGRPGFANLGVCASGALDQPSARQANRLVGNEASQAVIENLCGGLVLRARADQVLAVTGARVNLAIGPSGRRPLQDAPFVLLDGETLTLGVTTTGLHAYIAVRGGIGIEPELGSRSTDTMSGLGPSALVAGSVLPVCRPTCGHIVGEAETSTLRLSPGKAAVLRITAGPRDDWFGPAGLNRLTDQEWLCSSASDRIGLRLELPANRTDLAPLERIREGELQSEGTVAGALQVPPSGLPVLFLADHPVTGGYPVIAVVVPEDLPVAAQLPPGTSVRFLLVDPDTLEPAGTAAGTESQPKGQRS
jgi:KipI family sensor histidine kinase inhibitor